MHVAHITDADNDLLIAGLRARDFGAYCPDPDATPPVEPVTYIPDTGAPSPIQWGQARPPSRAQQVVHGILALLGLALGLYLVAQP